MPQATANAVKPTSLLDGGEQVVVFLERGQVGVLCLGWTGLRNRKPALLALIIPRSLWLSPAAMVSKPQDCSARTVVSFDSGQRMRKPAMVPSSATSSSLQNSAGQPSFAMRAGRTG